MWHNYQNVPVKCILGNFTLGSWKHFDVSLSLIVFPGSATGFFLGYVTHSYYSSICEILRLMQISIDEKLNWTKVITLTGCLSSCKIIFSHHYQPFSSSFAHSTIPSKTARWNQRSRKPLRLKLRAEGQGILQPVLHNKNILNTELSFSR